MRKTREDREDKEKKLVVGGEGGEGSFAPRNEVVQTGKPSLVKVPLLEWGEERMGGRRELYILIYQIAINI